MKRQILNESQLLKEGTSNFSHMGNLPLYVFYTYDEILYEMENDSDYPQEDDYYTEDGDFDADAYEEAREEFEQNYWDKIDVKVLDESEMMELDEALDDLNRELIDKADDLEGKAWELDNEDNAQGLSMDEYNKLMDEAGLYQDLATFKVESGYYAGAQIGCKYPNSYDELDKEGQEFVLGKLKEIGKRFGLTQLGVSYRFSNGETGYHKVEDTDESLKEELTGLDYNKLFLSFLNDTEFELIKCDDTNRKSVDSWRGNEHEGDWALIDLQGGNLGDIEGDRFNDASDILDRMDTYINDYYMNEDSVEYDIDEEDIPEDNWSCDGWVKWYTPEMQKKYPQKRGYIEIMQMICNPDKIDLNKVYEMQGGEHKEVGTAVYVIMFTKNGGEPQSMYQGGKEIALHCTEQLANKLVDAMNTYDASEGIKFVLRRESYAPTNEYVVWEQSQVEEEIGDITLKGKAYNWEKQVLDKEKDIVNWLYEHKQATEDALSYFKKENLEDIDIFDLVDWIDYHSELSRDFTNKFGFGTNSLGESLKEEVEGTPHKDDYAKAVKKHKASNKKGSINNLFKLGGDPKKSMEKFNHMNDVTPNTATTGETGGDACCESKQINEGPGAGYWLEGSVSDIKVSKITEAKVEEGKWGTVVRFQVEAKGVFDGSCSSYYYGAKVKDNVDVVALEFDEMVLDELDKENVKDIDVNDLNNYFNMYNVNFKSATIGGGWSHSKFDGYAQTQYSDDLPYGMTAIGILFNDEATSFIDYAVQGENVQVEYKVDDEDEYFETEEEAIEYAKENHCNEVVKTEWYFNYTFGDEDADDWDSETVWTNDEDDDFYDEEDESLEEGAEGKKVEGKEYVIYRTDLEDEQKAPIVAIRSTRTEAESVARFNKKYPSLNYEEVPKGKFKVGDDFYGPFDDEWNKNESLNENDNLNERMTSEYESEHFIAKCEYKPGKYRNYYYVHLIDKDNNREYAKGSYGWINRTWEGFEYKTALLDACRKYGLSEDKIDELSKYNNFKGTLEAFDEMVQQRNANESLNEAKDEERVAHYQGELDKLGATEEECNKYIKIADDYEAKADRGFITYNQMDEVANAMGLKDMTDNELARAWKVCYYTLDREAFKEDNSEELERWHKYSDAASAFAEVINREARARKEKGNYTPKKGEPFDLEKIIGNDYSCDNEGLLYLSRDAMYRIVGEAKDRGMSFDELMKLSIAKKDADGRYGSLVLDMYENTFKNLWEEK